jgi:hypothetical protein
MTAESHPANDAAMEKWWLQSVRRQLLFHEIFHGGTRAAAEHYLKDRDY